MNILPLEVRINIFSYIEDDLTSYWKSYFSKNIIIQLNPKEYFSKHVIPEIDMGWKYITLYSGPCHECHADGYQVNNILCNDCIFVLPCINCYWYNSDPYDVQQGCYCEGKKAWVSWKQLCEYFPSYKKYPRYYDLTHSLEWLSYMENLYNEYLLQEMN